MSSRGFLVCADITGYTGYLSHSELEHATGTLADLLRLLLDHVQAPLRLSRVEGDAVISYALGGAGIQGQLVVDQLDDTYVAFRRALQQMVLNTSCRCNACANIGELDLKFVVHYGEFAVQRLGQQDELVGPEVNLLFRLAKNRVRQSLGLPGYVAFTAEALEALSLPGFRETLLAHVEDDPERGPVALRVRDMRPIWESQKDRAPVVIPAGEVVAERSRVVMGPPELVFTLLAEPATRTVFFEADAMDVDRLADGRIGPDAVYVCSHGDTVIRQTVIDWAPPHRCAFTNRIPGGMTMTGTFRLDPVLEGTRVTMTVGIPRGLKGSLIRPVMRRQMAKWFDRAFAALDRLVAERSSAA
ncbi:MAG TPA: hypothetical protein DCY40_06005 [Actinobacteria bacterium]|nr:hypothetical protein [Actinomycetota bacterium]